MSPGTSGRASARTRLLAVLGASVSGTVAGVGILHPLTMVIYWFEFHPELAGATSVWAFVALRMRAGFSQAMLPMTGAFAAIGFGLGLIVAAAVGAIARARRQVGQLEAELDRSLTSLLEAGEGETLEFKAALRWDLRAGATSRAIEGAVVRTIAGLMNHRGGSLLLGVDDRGRPVGLRADLATLRRQDRDGFEQFVVGLAERYLGADACTLLHILFHDVDGHDICRVVVEQASRPIYLRDERGDHYFLRTGNSTRELDAREAVDHITSRGTRRRSRDAA